MGERLIGLLIKGLLAFPFSRSVKGGELILLFFGLVRLLLGEVVGNSFDLLQSEALTILLENEAVGDFGLELAVVVGVHGWDK